MVERGQRVALLVGDCKAEVEPGLEAYSHFAIDRPDVVIHEIREISGADMVHDAARSRFGTTSFE
jgi:hypothetical protein